MQLLFGMDAAAKDVHSLDGGTCLYESPAAHDYQLWYKQGLVAYCQKWARKFYRVASFTF